MAKTRVLRIGAVNYLNTKPLVCGLAERAGDARIEYDFPSRLADRLAAGELDVALIPSVEFFQDPGYRIVSDACIGCRGPVLSVKLFCRTPAREIRTLALDEGSRTSAALARILLKERFGLAPALCRLALGGTLEETATDGVLLIGDRAIHSPRGEFAEVWDLGDEWRRHTGQPFVFAMWVARGDLAGSAERRLGEMLEAARDEGVSRLEEIAAREGAALGLTVPQCWSYLRDNLYFYLGEAERRGLELFRCKAAELRLAPRQNVKPVDAAATGGAVGGTADATAGGAAGGAAGEIAASSAAGAREEFAWVEMRS